MSMFTDRAYVSTAAKMNACAELARKERKPVHLLVFPKQPAVSGSSSASRDWMKTCSPKPAIFIAPKWKAGNLFSWSTTLHSREIDLIKTGARKDHRVPAHSTNRCSNISAAIK